MTATPRIVHLLLAMFILFTAMLVSVPPSAHAQDNIPSTFNEKMNYINQHYTVEVTDAYTDNHPRRGKVEVKVTFRPDHDGQRAIPLKLYVVSIHDTAYILKCSATADMDNGTEENLTISKGDCYLASAAGDLANEITVLGFLDLGIDGKEFKQTSEKAGWMLTRALDNIPYIWFDSSVKPRTR